MLKLPSDHFAPIHVAWTIVSTNPSVDAVTTATFPSKLRLEAAVVLILRDLKVPENLLTETRRDIPRRYTVRYCTNFVWGKFTYPYSEGN